LLRLSSEIWAQSSDTHLLSGLGQLLLSFRLKACSLKQLLPDFRKLLFSCRQPTCTFVMFQRPAKQLISIAVGGHFCGDNATDMRPNLWQPQKNMNMHM